MRKILVIPIISIIMHMGLNAQENQPIWDIGTKWTHEFNWIWSTNDITDYAITEIVDTITIDGFKLYKTERIHSTCNSTSYLYYQGNKVYTYDITRKILHLLYDFGDPEDYKTKYEIQCEVNPELEGQVVELPIKIDSVGEYEMPDGSFRKIQYLTAIDSFRRDSTFYMNHNRSVLEGIGFMDNYGYDIHEWSINEYFCDRVICFTRYLRCFENDSIIYNFAGFPCDSVFTSNINELKIVTLKVYPNPTNNNITVLSNSNISKINVFTLEGKLIIDENHKQGESIIIPEQGVYILKAKIDNKWISRRIICIK